MRTAEQASWKAGADEQLVMTIYRRSHELAPLQTNRVVTGHT